MRRNDKEVRDLRAGHRPMHVVHEVRGHESNGYTICFSEQNAVARLFP
jgi:hypothetical protein